eukprot:scaffold67959_cov44-Cyclotella_meneghiniana.AAC.2
MERRSLIEKAFDEYDDEFVLTHDNCPAVTTAFQTVQSMTPSLHCSPLIRIMMRIRGVDQGPSIEKGEFE